MSAPAPMVVELVRGAVVESTHRVHAVVADVEGRVVHVWGEPERPTHPRSAVKPIQALPLLETGAGDAFGVSEAELALACASHNGEQRHVDAVQAWLSRLDLSDTDLDCGVQDGRGPSPAGNNCSGKHAGFLTLARHLGVDPAGYIAPDHPVQRLVTAALAQTTETDLDPGLAGTDGCGIPVHPVPLRALAVAAARFGTPASWPAGRAAAAKRLAAAMVAEPWLVAGTGRMVTDLLDSADGEVVVKDGAEGVQMASLPGRGLGVVVKVEDGSGPASEVALGHVLELIEGQPRAALARRREVRNHVGTHVASWRIGQV